MNSFGELPNSNRPAWLRRCAEVIRSLHPDIAPVAQSEDAERYRVIRKMLHWFKNFDSPEEVDRATDAARKGGQA